MQCLSAARGMYVCSVNRGCDIVQDFPGGLKWLSALTHCFVCSKEGMSRWPSKPVERLFFRKRVLRVMETHTKIHVCTTYWMEKRNAFQTIHNLYSLSFDLIFQCGLTSFTKGVLLPALLFQGSLCRQQPTKLISRPEKTKPSHIPRVQFAVTLEGCGLGFEPCLLTVWRVMCSSADVSPAVPMICSKVEYREHFLFLAQRLKLKCNDIW